ncbi:MAG: CDP-alcohol phosphatidyltransferase family protein [Acidobacteria bacterium]|nr:CDP-alcohol phosphatidyltransferase family protein [Acidobacteriota bacterium]
MSDFRELLLLSNQITLVRIGLTIAMCFLVDGNRILFLYLLLCAAASDVLDGFVARLLDQETLLGRHLDSVADAFLFLAGAWWLYRLHPEIFLDHPVQMLVCAIFVAAPQALAMIKLRRNAGFHLASGKVAGAWGLFCFFWATLVGYNEWFHYVFTAVVVVRNVEAMLLLALLDDPYQDLRPSIFCYSRKELRRSHSLRRGELQCGSSC